MNGLLGTTTGAKLKKVIDSVSAPHDAEDTRTGAQRRVQGLDDLLSRILGEGLPSDKGVRPHMSVFVDAETLKEAAEHVKQATENPGFIPEPMPPVEPARLAGHGAIGPNLLMYFLCISDFTAFLMKEGDDDDDDDEPASPEPPDHLSPAAHRAARDGQHRWARLVASSHPVRLEAFFAISRLVGRFTAAPQRTARLDDSALSGMYWSGSHQVGACGFPACLLAPAGVYFSTFLPHHRHAPREPRLAV